MSETCVVPWKKKVTDGFKNLLCTTDQKLTEFTDEFNKEITGKTIIYLVNTILNRYKIWRFEDPRVWLVLILVIFGHLHV